MSSYRRSHPLLRPGQGEREFLPRVTHTILTIASQNYRIGIQIYDDRRKKKVEVDELDDPEFRLSSALYAPKKKRGYASMT
jgi:hypothetical protein